MKTYQTVLVLALALAPALSAHGDRDRVTPPPVPQDIEVPAGSRAFYAAHAVGTQGYLCAPKGSGVEWAPFGPQATLFNEDGEQVLTHYLSPNPLKGGTAFPTWEHSRDTSRIWGQPTASSADPAYVAPGAIAWLRLEVVGAQAGPTGGDRLTRAAFIQRVNTVGGKAPATGCSTPSELFNRVWIPYEADYYFFR